MARGDLVKKNNGKWVFLLNGLGTESREFDSKPDAEAGFASFLALEEAVNEEAAIAAEEDAKAEAVAQYQRDAANFERMKSSIQR